MTRRFTCYVIFVTLIWGAHTETEERRHAKFKSNLTRNDFSNLLSSLIKLNEQRVKVLQKLYRLENGGVLSEVLRSADKKTANRNSSNLYLIVMSKNPTVSSHRNSGFQLVDTITSLEVAGSNNIPKLDYVLDPASFVFQNDRKKHKLTFKSIFEFTSRGNKQKKTTQNRIIKITTTKKPFQYPKGEQRKYLISLLKASKDTIQANTSHKIKIVSKNKSSNESKRNLYPKPITIKHILRNRVKKPKYYLGDKVEKDQHDKVSLFNTAFKNNDSYYIKKTTQINRYMFTELYSKVYSLKPEKDKKKSYSDFAYHDDFGLNIIPIDFSVTNIDDTNNPKPGIDKVISKITDISDKKIDDNNHPEPGTVEIISKVNDNSVKKIDYNNHPKPETNQNTLKAKVQGNQNTKLIRNKSSRFRSVNKTSRIETDTRTTVRKNSEQIIKLNGTVDGDNASESSHMVFNISPIPNYNLNINKDNAHADDFMANIRSKNATKETDHGNEVPLTTTDITLSVATSKILAPLRFPKTARNTPIMNNLDFHGNVNNLKESSNNDKMKTAKDLHNGDIHNDVKEEEKGKRSKEVITLVLADEGKGKAERSKELQDFQLTMTGFDKPETKPIARKAFQKCLNKKAKKLCCKSCKSAYRNVCRRMKCSSRSKRALKKECKRSCEKAFKSSKYSDEDSDESGSDESDDSDYS